jgi:hypothetical protein
MKIKEISKIQNLTLSVELRQISFPTPVSFICECTYSNKSPARFFLH